MQKQYLHNEPAEKCNSTELYIYIYIYHVLIIVDCATHLVFAPNEVQFWPKYLLPAFIAVTDIASVVIMKHTYLNFQYFLPISHRKQKVIMSDIEI